VTHGWVSKHLIADTLGSFSAKDYCGQTKIKIYFNITVFESILLKHNLKFGKCFFIGIHGRK
jgi:hypothetical protein